MIRKAALAALPLTMLAAASAMAADLPTKKPAPYMAPLPVFTWTGMYVGVQGGWAGGGSDRVGLYSNTAIGANDNIGHLKDSGGYAGLRVGYNWQLSPVAVVGVVGDMNFGSIKDSIAGTVGRVTFAANSKINWDGSVRVNAGYAMDRALFYVTGGLAFAHQKYALATTVPVVSALNSSRTHVGFTVGAGVQYAVTNNLIAGLEYRYSRFKNKTLFGTAVGGQTWTVASPDFHRISVSLDYKF